MKVELIYDDDCPNADGARQLLTKAMRSAGREPEWIEHCRQDPGAPAYAQNYGSPTILVDGQDVAPSESPGGNACRIYRDDNGRMSGLPPGENIIRALQTKSQGTDSVTGKTTAFASVFAGLAGMLPVVSCAACWPAYTAVLAGLGIGFVDYSKYLLPLMIALSVIGLAGLFYRAEYRHGLLPFTIGAIGAAVIFIGRFALEQDAAMYPGTALFLLAAVWNSWPQKRSVPADDHCDC
jgi:mercuric ion transport protein